MNTFTTFLAVIAVILLLCAMIGARNEREAAAALRKKLIREFGAVPDKRMSALRYEKVPAWYLRHLPEDGIDDITWNDLDLDAVYARMDSTQSGAGEEVLYALLRSPVRALPECQVAEKGEENFRECGISLGQIRYFEDEDHT